MVVPPDGGKPHRWFDGWEERQGVIVPTGLGCVGCLGDGVVLTGDPDTDYAALQAAGLTQGASDLPILQQSITVTPSTSGSSVITNPTSQPITVGNVTVQPGQTVTIPAATTPTSTTPTSSGTMLAVLGVLALILFMSQK